jgi:hypothetical protein
MAAGTLDVMKLQGEPVTYQVMFELNVGGTFVARIESEELVPFMHEEMRVDLDLATRAARQALTSGRAQVEGLSLEENDLHAVMDYLEEDV